MMHLVAYPLIAVAAFVIGYRRGVLRDRKRLKKIFDEVFTLTAELARGFGAKTRLP